MERCVDNGQFSDERKIRKLLITVFMRGGTYEVLCITVLRMIGDGDKFCFHV